jgi:hypothetical protein
VRRYVLRRVAALVATLLFVSVLGPSSTIAAL